MITKIALNDYKEISDIYNAIFSDKWSENSFQTMLKAKNYFGYKFVSNKSISGFILCREIINEIEVITFCVKQEYREQGIGKQLLSAISKYSNKKKSTIFLEVSEQNHIAIKLYTSLGYKKISIRKGYYNGVDAIVMQKESTSNKA